RRILCIVLSCSPKLLCCTLGGELLVALPAVEQMALHGRASLRYRAGLYRLYDLLMLFLKCAELHAPLDGGCALPHRSPRNDEAAEILQTPPELRIACGAGDCTVECEILVDRALAPIDGRLDGVKFVHDPLDLRGRGALGGKSGRFDLDSCAQFHHIKHLMQWRA